MTERSLVLWDDPYPGPVIGSMLERQQSSSLPLSALLQAGPPRPTTTLTEVLAGESWDQVVVVADLGAAGLEAVLDRIDGSRWVVITGVHGTPDPRRDMRRSRLEFALLRRATVFETSLVFGRGVDDTISRFTRALRRWPLPVCGVKDGRLVRPAHVDDVVSAIVAHGRRPASGRFLVAGDEAVPISELVEMLREMLGLRLAPFSLSPQWLERSPVGRALTRSSFDGDSPYGRSFQMDLATTMTTFGWRPRPLAHRFEQAVLEAVA